VINFTDYWFDLGVEEAQWLVPEEQDRLVVALPDEAGELPAE
jgi:hypothetical protein